MLEIFPKNIQMALENVNIKGLQEIRLRINQPVIVNFGGLYFLSETGITDNISDAIICSKKDIEDVVFKACECSIYAFNEEIKQGFVSLKNGYRLGVCGEIVQENGIIKTIKNFTSVSLRIPHEIKNCSLKVLPYLFDDKQIFSTLIISLPGKGKTTFLRDLCQQFSKKFLAKNILVIDERGEIACCNQGEPQINLGPMVDVNTNCTKLFGLENGIRTLAPEVVFLDELANINDIDAVEYAMGSGVKIIATAHALDLKNLEQKQNFEHLLNQKFFERIVVLSSGESVGIVDSIYDSNKKLLYYSG